MANDAKKMKVCPCGRIIIDPNNLSGFCPRCVKSGLEIGIPAGLTVGAALAKKYGKPLIEEAIKLTKNLKK